MSRDYIPPNYISSNNSIDEDSEDIIILAGIILIFIFGIGIYIYFNSSSSPPSPPTPSEQTPSEQTPSGPTPSGPTPSEPTPSGPTPTPTNRICKKNMVEYPTTTTNGKKYYGCSSIQYQDGTYGIGPYKDGFTCDINCICPEGTIAKLIFGDDSDRQVSWKCLPQPDYCPQIIDGQLPQSNLCPDDWMNMGKDNSNQCAIAEYDNNIYGIASSNANANGSEDDCSYQAGNSDKVIKGGCICPPNKPYIQVHSDKHYLRRCVGPDTIQASKCVIPFKK